MQLSGDVSPELTFCSFPLDKGEKVMVADYRL